METLAKYVSKFSKLNVARIKGLSAPHKPILLLAIIDAIAAKEIATNRIDISPDLVGRFKGLWHLLVHTTIFTPNFSLPFYHLKSEGFWHLQTLPGSAILLTSSNSIKSFGHLKQVIEFAYFEDELYALLLDAESRQVLRAAIMNKYFPGVQAESGYSLVSMITDQILNEPSTVYKQKAVTFDEEEIYVRGGVFKKTIGYW